jgi:multidrug efflux pump subunit AcrB
MAHKSAQELIDHVHNLSRFCVEHPQVTWAALLGVCVWGVIGYRSMPQRKDPNIPVRVAVATCTWPGATAQQVEQLVTRPIEQAMSQNKTLHPPTLSDYGTRSISLPGASFVYVQLAENITNTREQFSDINLKLQAVNASLPQGAGPVQFQSDFGDTAALMLTVASPPVDDSEVQLRVQSIRNAIREVRSKAGRASSPSVSIVYSYPLSLSQETLVQISELFRTSAEEAGILEQTRLIQGRGFLGVDGVSRFDDAKLTAFLDDFRNTKLPPSEQSPDVWPPVIIRDLGEAESRLRSVEGSKYTYAELDQYTNLIARTLLGIPQANRVDRKGILPQQIYLGYSQERLAAYGLQPADLSRLLNAQNITASGGALQTGANTIQLEPTGQFQTADSIGGVVVAQSSAGAPAYLRDVVQISRGYQMPAQYLNYYNWTDKKGQTHRSRAVTVSVYLRDGEQISKFGQNVNERLDHLKTVLPPDLLMVRTSDQPLQVEENIDLFMDALYEAIGLVVIVSFIGFWDWRSTLLMALSIPITLAMTFGIVQILGIDLQQISIATLIIALGLLVDDPVVANDAIKNQLAAGVPRLHAAWIGPTKLARAILYATVTNIIAYLPFLLITGTTGIFLYSLPVVMTAALVSSRLTSMTFIPLLGYYLLRAPKKKPKTAEEMRQSGFYGFYYRLSGAAIRHRWAVFAGSLVFLLGGGMAARTLITQFFPDDVQYWSYVDVWLPNLTPLSLSDQQAQRAEAIIRRTVAEFEKAHPSGHKAGQPLLTSLTTFVGGGGPRFWFTANPEMNQTNYSEVLIQVSDKDATPELAGPIEEALTREMPGAYILFHQLQTNPVEEPVEVRIYSTSDIDPKDEPADNERLRAIGNQVHDLLHSEPGVQVAYNEWFQESPQVTLRIDPDRANLAGITNSDVAGSTSAAISGTQVTTLREGDLQIPVVARLLPQQRAQLSDIRNLYIYSAQGQQKVPFQSVASAHTGLDTVRIRRQDNFRMMRINAYPQQGVLPSQVINAALPKINAIEKNLPPGYRIEIGGERAKQQSGFTNLTSVLAISLVGIYGALLLQFNNAVKPLLVFAATPYGVIGALLALVVMHTAFGFMAFLGIASLIGVIVSHVIVLFDFIEEMREEGEPFEQAVRDAGIHRLRPVLITVGATVLALFPLAIHGGPLWLPLCYAQIGGLCVATFITLLLVPVLYSIAVLDLKVIKWETIAVHHAPDTSHSVAPGSMDEAKA